MHCSAIAASPSRSPARAGANQLAWLAFIWRLAATIAWGENREIHGNLDGYLLEWDYQLTPRGAFYGRGEIAAKDILGLGSLFVDKGEAQWIQQLTSTLGIES